MDTLLIDELLRRGHLLVIWTTAPGVRLGNSLEAMATRTVFSRYKKRGEPGRTWSVDERHLVTNPAGTPQLRQQDYGYVTSSLPFDFRPFDRADLPARLTIMGRHNARIVVRTTRVFHNSSKNGPRWFIPANSASRRTLQHGDEISLVYRAADIDTRQEFRHFERRPRSERSAR